MPYALRVAQEPSTTRSTSQCIYDKGPDLTCCAREASMSEYDVCIWPPPVVHQWWHQQGSSRSPQQPCAPIVLEDRSGIGVSTVKEGGGSEDTKGFVGGCVPCLTRLRYGCTDDVRGRWGVRVVSFTRQTAFGVSWMTISLGTPMKHIAGRLQTAC